MIGLDFGFGALEAEFWRFLFVMTRIGAALFAAPLFGAAAVAPQVRVIVTGALAIFVCCWTQVAAPPAIMSLAGVVIVAGEVVIGLAIGFVMQLAFAAPVIGAELIGAGMGMSIAAAADPINGAHSAVLGQYFSVVMTVMFFALGAHLDWISLLVESYRTFPPGAPWMVPARLHLIDVFAGDMFLAGLSIALPVVVLLLVVHIVTGVIGRSAPALNLFALGLPAGVLAGIAALIVSAPLIAERLAELAHGAVAQSAALLAHGPPVTAVQ
jgi:flagellar biosynthetic protein FliR